MGRLDISIPRLDMDLTGSFVTIEEKIDGVKLNIYKDGDEFIFAYKGNILYPEEFGYLEDGSESIGTSQFQFALKKFGKNSIPHGTEMMVEFTMRKPTLSANYKIIHRMILLGYAESKWTTRFGKITSSPGELKTEKCNIYARELGMDTPPTVFQGIFPGNQEEFFRRGESVYGGKPEGYVVKIDGKIFKWQQNYQNDQVARGIIKSKYRGTREEESKYWKSVQEISQTISRTTHNLGDLRDLLRVMEITIDHPKKTKSMIKDDIQLTTKSLIFKNLPGNNNALILGKFRVIHLGHYNMIQQAIQDFDEVVLCLVGGNSLRKSFLEVCFPGIRIIENSNGNISRIIQKSPVNINTIIAGSDRAPEYRDQINKMIGVNVKEVERGDNSISATRIFENIMDEKFFQENTPSEMHKFYKETVLSTGAVPEKKFNRKIWQDQEQINMKLTLRST